MIQYTTVQHNTTQQKTQHSTTLFSMGSNLLQAGFGNLEESEGDLSMVLQYVD